MNGGEGRPEPSSSLTLENVYYLKIFYHVHKRNNGVTQTQGTKIKIWFGINDDRSNNAHM